MRKDLPHAKTNTASKEVIPPHRPPSALLVSEETDARKASRRCVFCDSSAHVEINDENITLCTHCSRVLQTKAESIRRFISA